jgi:hypothetical protein
MLHYADSSEDTVLTKGSHCQGLLSANVARPFASEVPSITTLMDKYMAETEQ